MGITAKEFIEELLTDDTFRALVVQAVRDRDSAGAPVPNNLPYHDDNVNGMVQHEIANADDVNAALSQLASNFARIRGEEPAGATTVQRVSNARYTVQLETARSIGITGNGINISQEFNGTSDITLQIGSSVNLAKTATAAQLPFFSVTATDAESSAGFSIAHPDMTYKVMYKPGVTSGGVGSFRSDDTKAQFYASVVTAHEVQVARDDGTNCLYMYSSAGGSSGIQHLVHGPVVSIASNGQALLYGVVSTADREPVRVQGTRGLTYHHSASDPAMLLLGTAPGILPVNYHELACASDWNGVRVAGLVPVTNGYGRFTWKPAGNIVSEELYSQGN